MSKSSTGAAERLTAVEWLSVRSHVAEVVKDAHPRMEPSTSVKIAERLLADGLIDVASVAVAIRGDVADEDTAAQGLSLFPGRSVEDSTEGGEGA